MLHYEELMFLNVSNLNIGVVSKLDYLHKLGYKSLFLNEIVDKENFNKLDANVGNTESLNTLRKELKERGKQSLNSIYL